MKTKEQLLQFIKDIERQEAEANLKKAETDLFLAQWMHDVNGYVTAEHAVNDAKKRLIVCKA